MHVMLRVKTILHELRKENVSFSSSVNLTRD